jgi:hypothetical protein
MKYLKTFEDFINESSDYSDLNEGVKFSDVQKIAREFLASTKSKFKVSDSQIHKMKVPKMSGMAKKGKEIRYNISIVVPEKLVSAAREFEKKFKEDNKEAIEDNKISFSVSQEIEGRKSLWPTNNKDFFDI